MRYSRKPNPHHPLSVLRDHLQDLKGQYRQRPTAELRQFVVLLSRQFPEVMGDREIPPHRHQLLDLLLEFGKDKFIKEWEKRYGWPFSDVHDSRVLKARVRSMQERNEFEIMWARLDEIQKENASTAEQHTKELEELHESLELNRWVWQQDDKDPEVRKAVWREGVILDMFLEAHEMAAPLGQPAPFNCLVLQNDSYQQFTIEQFLKLGDTAQASIRAFMARRIKEIVDAGFAGVVKGSQGKIVDRRIHPNAIPAKGLEAAPLLKDLVEKKRTEKPETAETP